VASRITFPPLALIIFRVAVFLAASLGLNQILELDIPLLPLIIGTLLGQLLALVAVKKHFSFAGFLISLFGIWVLSKTCLLLADFITPVVSSKIFIVDTISDSFFLTLLFAGTNSLITWFLCRISGFATLEAVSILISAVFIISDHRNFKLDNPKFISDLAWQLSIQPVSAYLISGGIIALIVAAYIFLMIKWNFKDAFKPTLNRSVISVRGIFATVFVITLIVVSFNWLFKYYHQVQKNLVANGVGQESSAGLSPLGFNSALGSTNQPAAMVRLDGDYTNNPFSPMLYLRENALSDLKGTELVIASVAYDTDLHRTSPNEPFIIDAPNVSDRKKLLLSAYLLTDHNLSFAIDFPISINPLKNPKPDRFKGAFQATSLVPTFSLDKITNNRTINPNWTEEVKQHYTRTVADPRYQELALRITANAATEIDKAAAIAKYLSDNSTYTLTPNHSVEKNADQVAPYLFGDLRGYCVHFAHATVFMLRSLGIPSRIGTGYLTDLSRAKDGHILLRMSDRHAWAEVYVNDIGWVPFDTKPTRVESHADSEIDMKLLEELMGMVGDEEISLPDNKQLNEPGLKPVDETNWQIPNIPWVKIVCLIFLMLFILKLYARFSWILPASNAIRIRRYYRSISSILIDLGYGRKFGETRTEYAVRLSESSSVTNLLPIIKSSLLAKYGSPETADLDEVKNNYHIVIKQLHESVVSRIISYLNPASSLLLVRGRW
jgi:hypothetical protein